MTRSVSGASGGPRPRRTLGTLLLGVVANAVLAVVKTAVGILGRSPALLADGVNSTADVAHNLVVGAFLRMAHKPPDAEHPFGHRRLENIAALLVGAFVMTSAMAILWDSAGGVYELVSGRVESAGAAQVALWVALATVGSKLGLAAFTRRVGRQARNAALLALARDHRNDVLSALGAAAGIYLGRSGYPWVDPLAGALVALVVMWTGINIVRESAADLMDTQPGQLLAGRISELVLGVAGVEELQEVHAHRFGPYLVLDVTLGLGADLSVAQADRIATQVEQSLIGGLELVRDVHVHVHPAGKASPARCRPTADDPR
ncbi:MAG: cation diffusion facilitator family transporter [Candidatus Bipolaricaulaceae bacterium]